MSNNIGFTNPPILAFDSTKTGMERTATLRPVYGKPSGGINRRMAYVKELMRQQSQNKGNKQNG